MHEEALKFLASQRIGVIAIEMMDGSPHAATVHIGHAEGPIILFETYRQYRKAEPLFGRPVSRASLVVGTDESNMKTLQMDGEVQLIDKDGPLIGEYLKKFPEKVDEIKADYVIFFQFKPTWWRFTDWTRMEGKTIYLSDGSVTVRK